MSDAGQTDDEIPNLKLRSQQKRRWEAEQRRSALALTARQGTAQNVSPDPAAQSSAQTGNPLL